MDLFKGPKIIYPEITLFLPFVYDETGLYVNNKGFIMTGKNLKFLTGFFNSDIFKGVFRDFFIEMGGTRRELRKAVFEKLKAPFPSPEREDQVNCLVDYILYCLKNPGSFTSANLMASYWEELINGLLYEIYFKEEMEHHEVMVSPHLPVLQPLGSDPVTQLNALFAELYAFEHPLRKSLYNLSLVPRIAYIKREAEKIKRSVEVEEDDE